MTPQKFTWQVKHGILTPPPDFFGKKYFLVHTHTLLLRLLYSETRSRSVFLLSFMTHLWTPRNVALMILTP